MGGGAPMGSPAFSGTTPSWRPSGVFKKASHHPKLYPPTLSGRSACWSLSVYLLPEVPHIGNQHGTKCLPGMGSRGGSRGGGPGRVPGGSRGVSESSPAFIFTCFTNLTFILHFFCAYITFHALCYIFIFLYPYDIF